jgi:hypothetical protein
MKQLKLIISLFIMAFLFISCADDKKKAKAPVTKSSCNYNQTDGKYYDANGNLNPSCDPGQGNYTHNPTTTVDFYGQQIQTYPYDATTGCSKYSTQSDVYVPTELNGQYYCISANYYYYMAGNFNMNGYNFYPSYNYSGNFYYYPDPRWYFQYYQPQLYYQKCKTALVIFWYCYPSSNY